MASTIDLNNGGLYHFSYRFDPEKGDYMILEDLLGKIATHLQGHSFVTEQRAELLVIANDAQNHIFVINDPNQWALDKFGRENRFTTWEHRRIGNDRIRRVIVRNMNLSGKDSEIMVAQVCNQARTKRGYCFLMPDYLNLNTQELGALMDTLMQLHLLRIGKSLSWLRRAYSQ